MFLSYWKWLSSNVSEEDVEIPNFKKPFLYEKNDRLGGGVAKYFRDTCMSFHGVIFKLMVSKQFGLKYMFVSENYLLVGFTSS